MKQIKHRYTNTALYEYDSGLSLREALGKAVTAGAVLYGANLYGADLYGADLRGANLRGANLYGANLREADLRGADLRVADLRVANLRGADLRVADLRVANLRGANLRGASLYGADLYGADLYGADLSDRFGRLVGDRPLLQIGPIGSRGDWLQAYMCKNGVVIRAGCFFDFLPEFESAVAKTHGNNPHGREYAAAIAMIKTHAEIWGNVKEGEQT